MAMIYYTVDGDDARTHFKISLWDSKKTHIDRLCAF